MHIKSIQAHNFKTFKDLEVDDLRNLNVLIGPNASGKSCFIEILKFLKDVTNHGLVNAVSLQGGAEYLQNVVVGSNRASSIGIATTPLDAGYIFQDEPKKAFRYGRVNYEIALEFSKSNVLSATEIVSADIVVESLKSRKGKLAAERTLAKGIVTFKKQNGKPEIDLQLDKPEVTKKDLVGPFYLGQEVERGKLLLEYFFVPPIYELSQLLANMAVYDFDPKLAKKAVAVTGKSDLEEDGSNLAIVLNSIVPDPEKKRKFCNLIRDVLPFVEDLNVDKFADKSLLFTLREIYAPHYFPASLMSDGTVSMAGLILALYFSEKPVIVIEEPERNIHPRLISKVVDMLRDASAQKQILVTTHNPEIVKYVDLSDLLLVSRDAGGSSAITRPDREESVRKFIENDIGVHDLYIRNLLGRKTA